MNTVTIAEQIEHSIQTLLTVFNIHSEPVYQTWSVRPTLSTRRARGVYVIFDTDRVLYVGKGIIRDRQSKHQEKFLGEFRNARDTRGFKQFRDQHGIVDLATLQFCSIEITGESAISAMEGGLIHLLQPAANDEISSTEAGPAA